MNNEFKHKEISLKKFFTCYQNYKHKRDDIRRSAFVRQRPIPLLIRTWYDVCVQQLVGSGPKRWLSL